jgi:hypothetical protein
MRSQAKTMIERQGFMDPDRKNSKHDEIQLWAYENIEQVLKPFTCPQRRLEIIDKTLESPLSSGTIIPGYVDLLIDGNILNDRGEKITWFRASIEIKSKIESCGELIRQINFYRRCERYKSTWIVIAPDDKFASILKEQNIYFFKYKDPATLF